MLRFKERLKPLTLLLVFPLIVGFFPEEHLYEQQPPDIIEEVLLIEQKAHQVAEQRYERLIEKQQILQDLGWYEGKIDGIKGPLTKAALEEFIDTADLETTSQTALLSALRQDDAPTAPTETFTTSTDTTGIPNNWLELAKCESGNWVSGGTSFEGPIRWWWAKPGTELPPWGTTIHHGGFQFHPTTWSAFKLEDYPQYAYDATPQQQYEVAKRVQAAQGFQAWPTCARKLNLIQR